MRMLILIHPAISSFTRVWTSSPCIRPFFRRWAPPFENAHASKLGRWGQHAPKTSIGHESDDFLARNTRMRKQPSALLVSSTITSTKPPRTVAGKAREYLSVARRVESWGRLALKSPIGNDSGDVPARHIRLPVSSTIADTRPPRTEAVRAWKYLAVTQRVGRWGRHSSPPPPHWA